MGRSHFHSAASWLCRNLSEPWCPHLESGSDEAMWTISGSSLCGAFSWQAPESDYADMTDLGEEIPPAPRPSLKAQVWSPREGLFSNSVFGSSSGVLPVAGGKASQKGPGHKVFTVLPSIWLGGLGPTLYQGEVAAGIALGTATTSHSALTVHGRHAVFCLYDPAKPSQQSHKVGIS